MNQSFQAYFNKEQLNIKNGGPTKEIVDQVNNISLRLRMLEEHYSNLRKKTQVIDQNMLNINKKNNREIKSIDISLNELKMDLEDTSEKIDLIIKELELSTKKEDFMVLEKYVNLWSPMNFVTREEVLRLIQEYKNKNK